ncbi:MAG: 6-phospho-beta-glucosidase [Clostridium sp.]|uniref:6-phospho-beta-glucosidase n=1 Tax=Clostridium sp. TaxID=1506 RepID=UPI00290003D2|nr:6-phospho-beta-glucosidase [Clostridium sp.]MDU1230346.1 6-phospho-beta-glucosidase [Clostridium sp.]MDU3091002.1 6-phospho-beta-glucosidase [Clostridium sp.]
MKKGKIKIATIGGGSSYTPELIEGFIKRKDELPISELWLVDIEEGREKLEIVGEMAKRMVKAAGLDWKVYLTLDRREALKDADFVSTQFRVGLLDARIKDERIPLSHGIIGQETNGAGGMFKAFRTIPVILDIIDDMRELCPNAWLVNFTNPSGMVTEAAIKYGGWERTVGLCNVPINCMHIGAKVLDLQPEDLIFKFAGLNHFHWHRVWDKNGTERTGEIIEKLYHPEKRVEMKDAGVANIKDIQFNYEQIEDLGILPCPYHRYYYSTDDMLKDELEEFKKCETRAEVVKKTEAELFELYKDPKLDYKPEQLTKRGGTHYSDAACELIASIHNDKHTRMVVSTKNNGAISDLPYDSIVEVSSIITAEGPQPITWGAFKSAPRGMVQVMKSMEELTISAAVTGNYNRALQAFTSNPLVPSGEMAKSLLDEMLVAHEKHLPQFADRIKEIER